MKNSTAKVVTLIPPAVPAGPPPMNMSAVIPNWVASVVAPMSMELKPAVRVCTDWKKLASSFCGQSSGPRVPGLFHSIAAMYTVPNTSRVIVAAMTMRVFIDQRRRRRPYLRICMMTGNPRPPRITAHAIVIETTGSPT